MRDFTVIVDEASELPDGFWEKIMKLPDRFDQYLVCHPRHLGIANEALGPQKGRKMKEFELPWMGTGEDCNKKFLRFKEAVNLLEGRIGEVVLSGEVFMGKFRIVLSGEHKVEDMTPQRIVAFGKKLKPTDTTVIWANAFFTGEEVPPFVNDSENQ